LDRKIRIGIVAIFIGVIIIAIGSYLLFTVIRDTNIALAEPTPVPVVVDEVFVASRDLPVGEYIDEIDIKQISVPIELIPRNAILALEDAIGLYAKVPLIQGEIILQSNLADPTNVQYDLAFEIDDDQVLFAFPASDFMSSLGLIQRGDLVDIFVTIEQEVPVYEGDQIAAEEDEEVPAEIITFDAFQKVSITAMIAEILLETNEEGEVIDPYATPSPSQVTIKAYLLALNPQDALVLKHLKDTGAIFDIVLRAPTSDDVFELVPVYDKFLNDYFGLEIEE
jgi:pilus assembly protein CpaB